MSASHLAKIFYMESKYELIKLLRTPIYPVYVVGFPLLFFAIFAFANSSESLHGYPVGRWLLATYACSGALGAALFAIGAGTAMEKGYGWLEFKRASAMPPAAYLFAKLFASMVFAAIVTVALLLLGLAANVHVALPQELYLLAAIETSVVVFASLGILFALVLPANAAPIISILYLPLCLLGGLWIPLEVLPGWLQIVAPVLPSYYASRLALGSIGYANQHEGIDLLVMLGFTVLFLMLAAHAFRRQEARS